jgi:PatG Domain
VATPPADPLSAQSPNVRPNVSGDAAALTLPVAPDGAISSCPACAAANARTLQGGVSPFVYAIGAIEPRFPKPSVEKEIAQAVGRAEAARLTDREALRKVLEDRHNRYLIRQLCWVLTIEGLDSYIVVPRDPADYDLLIQTLRSSPRHDDLDVVLGFRGPIASPDLCNGLTLPILVFDVVYSFDKDSFLKAIPRPEKADAKEFSAAAEQLFDLIMQKNDSCGGSDNDRALNYLAVRYPAIYAAAAKALAENSSPSGVKTQISPLCGARKIMDVILSFTHRTTDITEKQIVRVDVTDEFPFLATKLSPYYDR